MKNIKYTVKNDIIFNFLFSHEDLLKDFLEAILKKSIKEVEIANQFSLNKIKYYEKIGVLDIKAKINEEALVNIEMQRDSQSYYTKRVLLYAGGLIRGELKAGDKYEDLKDVIMINILDFTIFNDIEDVHTIWKLKEINHLDKKALEGLEIHFVELDKFRNSKPDMYNKLNQWLALIDTENKKWMEVAMEENKKIKEAKEKVDDFMSEEDARRITELREKWRLDYDSSISSATKKGIAIGEKKGMAIGKKDGIAIGKAKLNKAKHDIAKKLLNKNLTIQEIKEITGLNEKEILKIKNNKE